MSNSYLQPSVTRAVVLAAGRGRRLRPFTDHVPKPLLPVNGRTTLDYILTALAHAGVRDVCLVTHYLAAQIEAAVGDGSRWDLHVDYRQQPQMLGTAHALQTAVDFMTAPCFILAADYILPPNYLTALAHAYRQSGTPLAVSLKRLPADELAQRSSVKLGENGRVLRIVEKPAPGEAPSSLGASFIFIVPPAVRAYLQDVPRSSRGEYEFQSVLNRMLQDGYEMVGLTQPPPPEWQPPSYFS